MGFPSLPARAGSGWAPRALTPPHPPAPRCVTSSSSSSAVALHSLAPVVLVLCPAPDREHGARCGVQVCTPTLPLGGRSDETRFPQRIPLVVTAPAPRAQWGFSLVLLLPRRAGPCALVYLLWVTCYWRVLISSQGRSSVWWLLLSSGVPGWMSPPQGRGAQKGPGLPGLGSSRSSPDALPEARLPRGLRVSAGVRGGGARRGRTRSSSQ